MARIERGQFTVDEADVDVPTRFTSVTLTDATDCAAPLTVKACVKVKWPPKGAAAKHFGHKHGNLRARGLLVVECDGELAWCGELPMREELSEVI